MEHLLCIYLSISVNLLSEIDRHTTLSPPLSALSSLVFVCIPRGFGVLIEWGVSRAAIHLDTSGGAPAGWQHGARGKRADSGESASWAQWLHVSLHGPESSGFHRYTHSPDSVWYVYTDIQPAVAPLKWLHCVTTHAFPLKLYFNRINYMDNMNSLFYCFFCCFLGGLVEGVVGEVSTISLHTYRMISSLSVNYKNLQN